jgi:alpha-glucosidase
MQWNASRFSGFSTHPPWLPVAANYEVCNVAAQKDDPASILVLYRSLIALRRSIPALTRGSYRRVDVGEDVLAYERSAEADRILIALNLSGVCRQIQLPSWAGNRVLLSTQADQSSALADLVLQANEGVIVGNGTSPKSQQRVPHDQ